MHWNSLLAAVVLSASSTQAILRFGCSQLVIERLDPLVNPGVSGTPHVHQVVGGDGFNATMTPDSDVPKASSCTSCEFSEDFSNYWTAALYFQHPVNGSFKRVPQYQSGGPGSGGFIVYYTQGEFARFQYEGRAVTPFPKGFRMLTGEPTLRTLNASAPQTKALTFRCYTSKNTPATPFPGGGVSSGVDSYAFPNKKCNGGIRAQVYFPTCWDGKNLDSPDHKSHVAFSNNMRCPASHPTAIPEILYEVTYDTSQFKDMWKDGDKQPFLFSTGDRTGLGQHGDYLFGWQGDALQRAMKSCDAGFGNTPPSRCPTLKTQAATNANKCQKTSRIAEDTEGWLTALPGGAIPDPR